MTELTPSLLLEGTALWDYEPSAGGWENQPAVRAFTAKHWHRLNTRDIAFNAIAGLALDVLKRIAKLKRVWDAEAKEAEHA